MVLCGSAYVRAIVVGCGEHAADHRIHARVRKGGIFGVVRRIGRHAPAEHEKKGNQYLSHARRMLFMGDLSETYASHVSIAPGNVGRASSVYIRK